MDNNIIFKIVKITGVILGIVFFVFSNNYLVKAEEIIDYTLDNRILTVHETTGFEGDLILPTPQMGEVDIIVFEESSGNSQITSLKLTANNEIIIEKSAFYSFHRLKSVKLIANDKITLGGEGWDWDDRFYYGCFEFTGVESVFIKTKELDMSDGWAFYSCNNLTEFECDVETCDIGVNAFSEETPWIQNQQKGFVYVADTAVAYTADEEEVTLPESKVVVDIFELNATVKSIIMPDNMPEIPVKDGVTWFTSLEQLESVKLSANLTKIPTLCFWQCSSLRQLEIPEKVTLIEPCAFSGCVNLKELTIPRNTWLVDETLARMTMFYNCDDLILTVYEDSPGEEFAKNSADDVEYCVIPKIKLKDKAVELAAQIELGVTGSLYETDLDKIKTLTIRGAKTLDDVSQFHNLEELTATFGWIDDVSPLSALKNLKKLDLSFNRIKDISPLGDVESLKEIYLKANMINDISAIEHVETIDVSYNYVKEDNPWIVKGTTRAGIRLMDLDGQWYYAMYYDGALVQVAAFRDTPYVYYRQNIIEYPEVENPELIEIKLFLWKKDESMQPYEVLGYWELPIISSEYSE